MSRIYNNLFIINSLLRAAMVCRKFGDGMFSPEYVARYYDHAHDAICHSRSPDLRPMLSTKKKFDTESYSSIYDVFLKAGSYAKLLAQEARKSGEYAQAGEYHDLMLQFNRLRSYVFFRC